jgi:hypothetical protein
MQVMLPTIKKNSIEDRMKEICNQNNDNVKMITVKDEMLEGNNSLKALLENIESAKVEANEENDS